MPSFATLKCADFFVSETELTPKLDALKESFLDKDSDFSIGYILKSINSYPNRDQLLILEQLAAGNISRSISASFELYSEYRDKQPNLDFNLADMISSAPQKAQTKKTKIQNASPANFKEITEAEADAIRLRYFKPRREDPQRYFVEDYEGKVFNKGKTPIYTEGLNQCSAVIVMNMDTGKVFASHSSVGHERSITRNLGKIGRGRKVAFIISGDWGSKDVGKYLIERFNISNLEISVENARSHRNVAYDPMTNEITILYKNKNGQVMFGKWSVGLTF